MKTILIASIALSSSIAACSAAPAGAPVSTDSVPTTAKASVASSDAPTAETAAAPAARIAAVRAPVAAPSQSLKLTDPDCVDPDLSKISASVSFTLCDGTNGTGTLAAPDANLIAVGATVDGVAGTYAGPAQPDLTNLTPGNVKAGVVVNGVTGTLAQPDLSALLATNLRSGITINGVTGSYGGSQPDLTLLVPGNVKYGVTINGVTGSYADLTNLTASVLKAGVTVAGVTGSIDYCTSNGVAGCITHTPYLSGDFTNLTAAAIKTGVTIAGVAGSLPNCAANHVSGCLTNASYLSADFTNLTAGNIKSGASVAGVTGQYPSSTYPLTGASGTELDLASFDARMKSSSSFSWFDSTGTRYVNSGDADITAANILSGVTVFGTTGSVTTSVSAYDLRYGVSVGGVAGALRLDCQNSIGSFVTLTNATTCGFDFVDMTPTPATCSSDAAHCMYKDQKTGLTFSHYLGVKTLAAAKTACSSLSLNGLTGWRVPGIEELELAAMGGIGPSTNTNMWAGGTYTQTWTQTVSGTSNQYNVVVDLKNGLNQSSDPALSSYQTICVR